MLYSPDSIFVENLFYSAALVTVLKTALIIRCNKMKDKES